MLHISKNTVIQIILFLLGFLAGGILYLLAQYWDIPSAFVSHLYGLIAALWGITIYRRISHRRLRFYLLMAAAFMFLLHLESQMRYQYFRGVPIMQRMALYLYNVSFSGLPWASLMTALDAGEDPDSPPGKAAVAATAFVVILDLLILTNDWHHLMYRFPGSDGEQVWSGTWLNLLLTLWVAGATAASLLILIRKCRFSAIRRLWYIPILCALPGILLILWYMLSGNSSPMFGEMKLFRIQEAYQLLYTLMLESYIQIGLIQANTDYEGVFGVAGVPMVLESREGGETLISGNPALRPEHLRMADREGSYTEADIRTRTRNVLGGRLYWQEDLSTIHALNEELEDALERISEENVLIEEENRVREARTAYEVKNRLYDRIAYRLHPQLLQADRLLQEAAAAQDPAVRKEKILQASILLVYVKRRANLSILRETRDRLPLAELYFAIRESLELLRQGGISCRLNPAEEGTELSAERCISLYEIFETVLEKLIYPSQGGLVSLAAGEEVSLRITVEAEEEGQDAVPGREAAFETIRGACRELLPEARLQMTEEDGLLYLRILLPGEVPV